MCLALFIALSTFLLFYSFFKHIFAHINAPLLGQFWKTEKCKSKEIRGGAFIIRPVYIELL